MIGMGSVALFQCQENVTDPFSYSPVPIFHVPRGAHTERMAIPEQQLERWSHQGAIAASSQTHNSIRGALDNYTWPSGMRYDAYLQGSYPNATNIRGDSDVDLVVETDSVFYSNLTDDEKRRLGLETGRFTWSEFREHVVRALQSYFGTHRVDATGNKCIKVRPTDNTLAADVIPCVEYRRYNNLQVVAQGMTFWTRNTNTQVINYPKIHIQ